MGSNPAYNDEPTGEELLRKILRGEAEQERIEALFAFDIQFLTQLKVLNSEYLMITAQEFGYLKPISVPCETFSKLIHWAIKGLEADESVQLTREALVELSKLGNGDQLGNSEGNMIARRVLQKLNFSKEET